MWIGLFLVIALFSGCGSLKLGAAPGVQGEAPPSGAGQPVQPLSLMLSPPAGTDRYVFLPLTSLGAVARIDSVSLGVTSIRVGLLPTIVMTTPDNKRAVVFNSGSYGISIIDVGTAAVTTVPVETYFNTMSLSPDGRYAVSFFNLSLAGSTISISNVRSFNEVSVVDVGAGTGAVYPVGFNPEGVLFTSGGAKGIVISDNELTIIVFSTATLTAIPLTSNPFGTQKIRGVVALPDGSRCFVSYQGLDQLSAVNLMTQAVTTVSAGPGVSDIALSADGSSLFTVNSGNNTVSVISTTTLTLTTFTPPSPAVINRIAVTPDGASSLLYSSSGAEAKITVMNNASFTFRSYPLIKPVSSLAVASSSLSAVILHQGSASTGNSALDKFYNSYPTISLFRIATGVSNPVAVTSSPGRLALSFDGAYAFLLLPSASAAMVADMNNFIVDGVSLLSTPVYVGVFSGTHKAYLSEEHPLGRVSFLDGTTKRLDTVTGFALNPLIR